MTQACVALTIVGLLTSRVSVYDVCLWSVLSLAAQYVLLQQMRELYVLRRCYGYANENIFGSNRRGESNVEPPQFSFVVPSGAPALMLADDLQQAGSRSQFSNNATACVNRQVSESLCRDRQECLVVAGAVASVVCFVAILVYFA